MQLNSLSFVTKKQKQSLREDIYEYCKFDDNSENTSLVN